MKIQWRWLRLDSDIIYSKSSLGSEDTMKIPLPSSRTIQRNVSKIDCEPGVLVDFLTLMKLKIPKMSKEDCLCGVLMDEMAVQTKLEYCMTKQRWIGYATVPLSKKQQDDKTKKGKATNHPNTL